MSLTGSVFLLLVMLVTVAAFVATVVLWPRLAASGPQPIIARALLLLGVNVLVVFTAAVWLNDEFTFFADWTDLHGAIFGSHGGATALAGGAAARAVQASLPPPGRPAAASDLPRLPAAATNGDRVVRYVVSGSASGLKGEVLVALPRGYADPANAKRRYPVLETFYGYPGDPAQWLDSMGLNGLLDKSAASHVIAPAIVVLPALEFPPGVDTECVDGTGSYPKVETWITRDVPDWVRHTFRVQANRDAWATIGMSAGAWCAAMATMLHPQQYAAAIVLGGYFRPEFSHNYRPFSASSAEGHHYDLIALAERQAPPVAMWIETSHSDPVSYPSSAKLLAVARAPLSVQALILTHAGHRLSIWRPLLPQVVAWLGANLPGFAPGA
jgi:enterochelin esterase-like enzyme